MYFVRAVQWASVTEMTKARNRTMDGVCAAPTNYGLVRGARIQCTFVDGLRLLYLLKASATKQSPEGVRVSEP